MPPDSELVAETREWLVKARTDLEVGAFLMTPARPYSADATFHAQPAAEKSLKAFLTWHGSPFRKTHNLEELGQQCVAVDTALGPVADQAAPLTEYAWKFRYPGEIDEPDRARAEEALTTARNTFEGVLARMPASVRP